MSHADELIAAGAGELVLATGESMDLADIVSSVQAVADQTQNVAWRFEDLDDDSRVEIRCHPNPRSSGDVAPLPDLGVEGTLHLTSDGRLFRCVAHVLASEPTSEVDGAPAPPGQFVEWAAAKPARSVRFTRDGDRLLAHEVQLAWEPDDQVHAGREPELIAHQTGVRL